MIIRTSCEPADLTFTFMEGDAAGHHYAVTHDCLLRDGRPYIYRMGEFHYSRCPSKDWKRELLKMKEGGVDVVASYVFWNHHEPEEGVFDFSGRRDVRRFIDTCEELGLPFFLRIGPWAHGEARNGGFPDWLVRKGCRLRSCDPVYLAYVKRLYEKIYAEVSSSRNIIGIQVENELTKDADYLAALQGMLREIGFRAPIWSATGWGKAKLLESLLPMFGGYPEAPWTGHAHILDPNANYFFSHLREDGVIGEDLLGQASGKPLEDIYLGKYPFLTCELGGGNQNTYHRRPLLSAMDIAALAVCKLGSGANGLGWYMYHGGVNPVSRDGEGRLVTFQESRESGYPNDCPVVSYDFQSPLGDCGQTRESYYVLKDIHRFVEAFGETLAPMRPFFPDTLPMSVSDTETPRLSVRSDGRSGFVFYNNHVHGGALPEKRENLTILLADGELTIPLTLPKFSCGLFPFNMKIGRETVPWVKAMPVSRSGELVEFLPLPGVKPEICLSDGSVHPLEEITAIGGVRIALRAPERREPEKMVRLSCERKSNVLPFEAFAHLRRLDGSRLSDHTAEYETQLPDGTEALYIRAAGNVTAAYETGVVPRLLSDHFCDGDGWWVDVRGVSVLRVKIQPLGEEDRGTIYFETVMPEGEQTPEIWALQGEH